MKTKKSRFTENQKIQLIGLHAVWQSLWRQCEAVEKAAMEVTGETAGNMCDRACDFLTEEKADVNRLEELLEYDSKKKYPG